MPAVGVPVVVPEPPVVKFNAYTQAPLEFSVVPDGQVAELEVEVELGATVQISDALATVEPLGQVYVVAVEPVETGDVHVGVEDIEPLGQVYAVVELAVGLAVQVEPDGV